MSMALRYWANAKSIEELFPEAVKWHRERKAALDSGLIEQVTITLDRETINWFKAQTGDPRPARTGKPPVTLAVQQRQRDRQKGDGPLPDVTVAVFQVGPVDDFAAAVAAVRGTASGDGIWTIPAAGVHSILQYPEVITAETSPAPTPATGDDRLGRIAEAVIAYESGVPATQAAEYVLFQEGTVIGVESPHPTPQPRKRCGVG